MHKNNTFNSLLKLINKDDFKKIVSQYSGDKNNHKFKSWNHLTTLIYSQLCDNKSLREIELSMNLRSNKHYHFGLNGNVKRSTLSYANNNRDCRIYADFAAILMNKVNKKFRKEGEDVIRLIDSSPISLFGKKIHSWCSATNNRRIKGLKLHLEYDLNSNTPRQCEITRAKNSDITVVKNWQLEEDKTYVFDRAYNDYGWFNKIINMKSNFVTRPIKTCAYKKLQIIPLGAEDIAYGIKEDSKIRLGNKSSSARYTKRRNPLYNREVRKIIVSRKDKDSDLVLITNRFDISAREVATLYKKRWAIELYFKWVKQKLKIKKFIGNSENAIKTQIYVALITYLLIAIFKQVSSLTKHSMKQVFDIIRNLIFDTDTYILNYKHNVKIPDKNQMIYKQMQFNFGH